MNQQSSKWQVASSKVLVMLPVGAQRSANSSHIGCKLPARRCSREKRQRQRQPGAGQRAAQRTDGGQPRGACNLAAGFGFGLWGPLSFPFPAATAEVPELGPLALGHRLLTVNAIEEGNRQPGPSLPTTPQRPRPPPPPPRAGRWAADIKTDSGENHGQRTRNGHGHRGQVWAACGQHPTGPDPTGGHIAQTARKRPL
jgi:hypothetical protein